MAKSNGRLDRIEKMHEEFLRGMIRLEEKQEKRDEQIGHLTNAWGAFSEAFFENGAQKLLNQQGINITGVSPNAERWLNGEYMEVDLLLIAKDKKVFICSVKTTLEKKDVDKLENDLKRFPRLFVDYVDWTRGGIIAGLKIPDKEIIRYAEEKGFYVLGISDEVTKLLNTKGFKPKIW